MGAYTASVGKAATTGGALYAGYTPTVYAAPTATGSGDGSSEANAIALSSIFALTIAAGTTVGLLPGVYSRANLTGAASRQQVAWNSPSSGSAGLPIRFVAKYPAVLTANTANWTEMRALPLGGAEGSAAFGSYGRAYIEWIGVYASDLPGHSASANDTSVCNLIVGASNCSIKYCVIEGSGTAKWGAANYHGITMESNTSGSHYIGYNRISGYYTESTGSGNANGCGIITIGGGPVTLEHNDVSGCGAGYFLKRAADNSSVLYAGLVTVRFNHFHDMAGAAVRIDCNNATGSIATQAQVYQNLAIDCGTDQVNYPAFQVRQSGGYNTATSNVVFQNNTVYSGASALGQDGFVPMANCGLKYWNNIAANNSASWASDSSSFWTAVSSQTLLSAEHNLYFASSTFTAGDIGTGTSLATWKATYGQDSAAPAAITSDPLFVGGGSYKLQAGSPALTLGRDLLNLSGSGVGATIPAGCYITGSEVIGTGA